MSLIIDALRKAEEERAALAKSQNPSGATPLAVPAPPPAEKAGAPPSKHSGPGRSKPEDQSLRRSKRVSLAVPISLSGMDSSGHEFHESTRTVVVNKHGTRVTTSHDLVMGSVVTIENRSLGISAKATVVSLGKRRFPDEPIEVGLQLSEAGNVWGIIFPPEDWEPGPPMGREGEELGATSRGPVMPGGTETSSASANLPAQSNRIPRSGPETPIFTSPEPPAARTTTSATITSPAPPPGAPLGPSRERIDTIAAAVLAKLTRSLDEAVDTRLKAYTEKIIRFTNQFALRVQSNFQDAANRTEDQMVVLIQQKLGTLADRVQGSRTVLENLLARFEAVQQSSKTLVEDTEHAVREASHTALESALQDLNASLRQGIASTSATLQAECQEQVLGAVSATVNATLAKADDRLSALMKDRIFKSYAELKKQQDQLIDGIKEQINHLALSGTTNIASRFEAMAGELVPTLREGMEKSLHESAAQVVTGTVQSLQEQAQLLTQDTLVSLQQAVQALQERMQEESGKIRQASEEQIGKTAKAFSDNVAERSELAMDAVQTAVEQGSSKLRAAQVESVRSIRAGVEDFQQQLTARSALALESFQKNLQDQARDLQDGAVLQFSQKLQTTADEMAEASADKVLHLIQDGTGAVTESLTKELEKRLAAGADEFYARSGQELQSRLQGQALAQLEGVIQTASQKLSEYLNKLTEEAGLTLEKQSQVELQKVSGALLKSTSETLEKEVQQLSARLQTELRAYQASVGEQAKKQLLTMAQSTVETLNKEAVGGLGEFRTRLRKLTQESHEESLRELEATFREALEKHRASIAVLIQQQAEQSRELAGLQIKTLSEQIVAKATEGLERQAGKSTRAVTEFGDQARVALENQCQKIELEAKNSLWEYQREMEQASNASLDKFRKDTGVLLDEVVFRLQQSVRSFQSTTADEVLSELQKASDNLLEVSAAQMRKQTEQSLNLITERLKEKEQEVVSDAANVFRNRIAEIFAILQSGSQKAGGLPDPERLQKQD